MYYDYVIVALSSEPLFSPTDCITCTPFLIKDVRFNTRIPSQTKDSVVLLPVISQFPLFSLKKHTKVYP